ncbi:MAG: CAP domain-containing protein [Thiohalocapsa sp.]|nr:CAP domain-containing protein [Thiohalocapsa sp.]MCF7990483.1 CAP domain-containing protein [Thiohalocapsa sp.]
MSSLATFLHQATNDERARHSLPPLSHDDALAYAASAHSEEVAPFLHRATNDQRARHSLPQWPRDEAPALPVCAHARPGAVSFLTAPAPPSIVMSTLLSQTWYPVRPIVRSSSRPSEVD